MITKVKSINIIVQFLIVSKFGINSIFKANANKLIIMMMKINNQL